MKQILLFLFIVVMTAACNRAASSAPVEEPAVNFPTLAPGNLPFCKPADLDTSSNFNITSPDIALGVTFTNKSKTICKLANPPQASLLDSNKKSLGLQTKDLSPVQTPPAAALMQLAPGESAIVTIIWKNFCIASPAKSVFIHLGLAEDRILDVEMKDLAVPRCTAKSELSTITVAPYSIPP